MHQRFSGKTTYTRIFPADLVMIKEKQAKLKAKGLNFTSAQIIALLVTEDIALERFLKQEAVSE